MVDRLDSEFTGTYERNGNEYWPLGWVVFLKGLLLPEFLAQNATQHSAPMPKQVEDVVKIISRYLKVVEETWPGADKKNKV